MGYRRRTGFLAGLTVAQISEFSIVFVAMGISLGHVGVQALGLTTLVGVVTITLSTYMIMYSQQLYARLGPWLAVFERKRPHRELAAEQQAGGASAPDVVVFGMGRYGERFAVKLMEADFKVLGIEHDPERADALHARGIRVSFGDAQDADYLESLPLEGVSWIVSSLPDLESNGALLQGLRQRRYQGDIAVVARDEAQGAALKRIGVPTVLYPFRDAVDFAVEHLGALIRSEKTP
jgi:hypothetical protein